MSPHYLVKCRICSSGWRCIIFIQMLMVPNMNVKGKQRHSKCLKWSPSTCSHASSLFRHWSIALSSTLCWITVHIWTTLCLKKRPTFKLCLTSSNLNRFSNFLHCWKAYEICYKKPYDNTHLTLGMLLHYFGKLFSFWLLSFHVCIYRSVTSNNDIAAWIIMQLTPHNY